MKKVNTLNKILIGISAVLLSLLIYKITAYKASERFYYISNVSNPKEFPIYITGIWFNLPNKDNIPSHSFNISQDIVNLFRSDWGVSEYDEAYEAQFLPNSLYVEYIDFCTQNYYSEKILLPKEKIIEIFKEAKKNNHLENLSTLNTKMGLEFHVGIANDGNIIFWLIGDNWQKEFYRTQLEPKPFPEKFVALGKYASKNLSKEKEIIQLFENIPDSVQTQLRTSKSNAQYKDSIPKSFNNFQK